VKIPISTGDFTPENHTSQSVFPIHLHQPGMLFLF